MLCMFLLLLVFLYLQDELTALDLMFSNFKVSWNNFRNRYYWRKNAFYLFAIVYYRYKRNNMVEDAKESCMLTTDNGWTSWYIFKPPYFLCALQTSTWDFERVWKCSWYCNTKSCYAFAFWGLNKPLRIQPLFVVVKLLCLFLKMEIFQRICAVRYCVLEVIDIIWDVSINVINNVFLYTINCFSLT